MKYIYGDWYRSVNCPDCLAVEPFQKWNDGGLNRPPCKKCGFDGFNRAVVRKVYKPGFCALWLKHVGWEIRMNSSDWSAPPEIVYVEK